MKYFFYMSLSGSTIYLLYIVLKFLLKERWDVRYRYIFLKWTLLYYLVPIPFFKKIYLFIWEQFQNAGYEQQSVVMYANSMRVIINSGYVYLSKKIWFQIITGSLFLIVTGLILGFRLKIYLKQRNILISCENSQNEHLLHEEEKQILCKDLKLKRKIIYLDSSPVDEKGKTAFTLGVFKPIVLYPAKRKTEEVQLILAHELQHIKKMDVLWRTLLNITRIFHFYNPLQWFFAQEFEIVSEMACDAEILKTKNRQQCELYAKLLLQMACEEENAIWSAAINNKKKIMKERVSNVMKNNKNIFGKKVSLLLVGIFIFINSFTCFAYEDINVWKGSWEDDRDVFDQLDIEFVPDGAEEDSVFLRELEEIHILYDSQFEDEEGNIYEMKRTELKLQKACKHTFINGKVTDHLRNGDGSCTIFIYKARRCTKCGHIEKMEQIKKYSCDPCTH